jgi:copper homeostasis protein
MIKNLETLVKQTNAKEFHSSAKTIVLGQMQFQNESVSMSGNADPEEFKYVSVDQEQIKAMLKKLKSKDNCFFIVNIKLESSLRGGTTK